MNAAHLVLQKIVALFGSVVNATRATLSGIVLAALQGAQEPGGKPRSRGEFSHAFHPADRGNRHYSGNDGNVDARAVRIGRENRENPGYRRRAE